jgi:hypothetical protein
MHRAPTPPPFLGQGGTPLPFADATEQPPRLAGRQPTADKHCPTIEVIDPVAVLTTIINEAPLGVAKHAPVLDASLTVGATKALRVKILGNPLPTTGIIQKVGDRENHTGTLPYAQISDMSHVS